MPEPTWKRRERQIAAYFDTYRTPGSGQVSRHTSSDTLHPDLYVEIKSRVKHTAVSLWDKTKKKATREGKTPVVALCENGRPGFWLLVHSDDLGALVDGTTRSRDSEPL